MLKVSECIDPDPVSVRRGAPLKEIIKVFREHRFHVLPVVEGERRVAGVITLDGITSVFQPRSSEITRLLQTMPFIDEAPSDELEMEYITPEMGILVVADEIMSPDFMSVSPGDSILKAYSVMKKNNTRLLLVTGPDGRLEGVLGLFDIIYTLFKKKGIIK